MNVIIIEDELPAARLLQRKLSKFNLNVLTYLQSVEESFNWLKTNPSPDLIFMDIQLSDGLSFDIFAEVDVKSAIIFTTAYDEYVLKAFKLNSVDYLLKPIDDNELEFSIKKFNNQNKLSFDLLKIKSLFNVEETFKERFTVKIGTKLIVVPTDSIECFYSENKASYLFTKEGKSYLLDYSLDKLEQIVDPKIFFRINRSQIIAMQSIHSISVYSNNRLKIILNSYKENECIVSREKVNKFKNWLD